MIKSPENEGFLRSYQQFSQLINHYARKMGDSSARVDLTEFFYELYAIRGDKSPNYIAVCIRNEFYRLQREKRNYALRTVALFDLPARAPDIEQRLDLLGALNRLCDLQKDVLILHFFYGYSIDEIAQKRRISRQAVNSCKNRALKKLRLLYLGVDI